MTGPPGLLRACGVVCTAVAVAGAVLIVSSGSDLGLLLFVAGAAAALACAIIGVAARDRIGPRDG